MNMNREIKLNDMFRQEEYRRVEIGQGYDYSECIFTGNTLDENSEDYFISDGYALAEDLHKHLYLLGSDENEMQDFWEHIIKPQLIERGYRL